MRVLHLTPELPYETGGGGRGREYFLCRRLVEQGHQVLNVSPVLPGEVHWAQALREVGVENWVVERPGSHLREAAQAMLHEPAVLGAALAAPVRALEMRVFWTQLAPLVREAVNHWRPDVAVIGHDMAGRWAHGIPSRIPAVLTLHNLTWEWYLSRAKRRQGAAALLLRAEAVRYRRHVLRLLPRYAAAVAVSTLEGAQLKGLTDMPVHVIPTGVDTERIRPAPEPTGAPRLLFAGTLGYPPNSQGIRWFADHVWPSVLRMLPGALLEVAGRDPPPSVLSLGERAGIQITGPVADMTPCFAAAHAAIVPILTGAGIRVKIVEAMANGRAVVSTSLGWEGLPDVEPGQHLLVADDPADFAAATVRVLRDGALRKSLAGAGRELAERRYDWRRLGDEQEAVLLSALRQ